MKSFSAVLTACFFFCLYLIFHYASVRAGGTLGEAIGTSIGKLIRAFIRLVIPRYRNGTARQHQRELQEQGLPLLENDDLR